MSEKQFFRGNHYGVFSNAAGYYVGIVTPAGQDQCPGFGLGWSDEILDKCNGWAKIREARAMAKEEVAA
jgi:hypothetical protein